MAKSKEFKLKAEDIKDLKIGMGACFATDRITVEGNKVNFMYRQKSDNEQDSGWRFFSGTNEDEEYMNNPDNISIYDVNTIANYDPSIISFLDSPIGSVFEKDKSGNWDKVSNFTFAD